MIAMIGTSDRLCWLAETCKILLLLLARTHEFAMLVSEKLHSSAKLGKPAGLVCT